MGRRAHTECIERAEYGALMRATQDHVRAVLASRRAEQGISQERLARVIGVNRVGEDGNGFRYPGRSVVHDPMGQRVLDLGSEENCQVAELNLDQVRNTRSQFPFQADADRFQIL